ncbi:AsmA family protein [Asticcacaulis sp. BYS171W]|uniref:AsmA family protein n=1 Tax=Asticcacaulis aquaticus TaxID=2984212 RepID=A0ABT5HUB5_9CAUL|nr:AsmA family protein [Asticcacaulis aquaticus]MDC7683512.1 AsmA family protein [Asticcacaulis aquaticus]
MSSFKDRASDFSRKARADIAGASAAMWAWIKATPKRVRQLSAPIRWTIGIVLALLIALILFLANSNWDWFRPTLSSIISGKTHRPVQITGPLRVHLFSFTPNATIGGLKIGQPDWHKDQTNLADIDGLAVRAELMPLFIGRIVLQRLEVTRPNVALYQDKTGRANWDFSDGKVKGKPTKLPPIKDFIITDGKIHLTSLQRKMVFTGTIDAREKAGSDKQAFNISGDGTLNGREFELKAFGGPLLNVRTSQPYPFDMTVRAGSTRLTAKGRVIHPFNLGQVDANVSVSGHSLADLYYLTGLTLPNTPPYKISAKVTRNERTYDIAGINGKVGGSDLHGNLKVDIRDDGRPYLTGDLNSKMLDFEDLGSLFGATAANAPAAPELVADPKATTGRRVLPNATLDIERVRGMDAKVTYKAASVRARPNLPLRAVSLGVSLDKGLLTLDPIDIGFPQGRLTGTAEINARTANQSNTVDLRVTGLAVQQWLPDFQGTKPLEGRLNARVRATGGGNSVHKAAANADGQVAVVMSGGKVRQSLAELLGVNATKGLFQLLSKDPKETDVRCAIATFNVQNGVMRAEHIVFDTGVVLVNGQGSINLNDESLKLVFKGKPKKFRLIRINAPIVIGGHLSKPTVGIQAGPAIIQGGLAAALQSVVPFLSLDTADDANCAGLISEARADGAPAGR